jgi:DNA (cytosine-5)-methyltransferase 1
MPEKSHIPIVDLFAGPGGLGEGFSSHDRFRIHVSAEMDTHAHATLRLRAFYRILKRKNSAALSAYYDFCNHGIPLPQTSVIARAWAEASNEAQQLVLGNPNDNQKLDRLIQEGNIGPDVTWVLIGGPPCQAYSLVGRSRNRGKADYKPEEDHLLICAEN